MMDTYFFRTKDLSVGYGGKALIHDINIELKKGEILTLVGPNGSGKSTILKSITKHLKTIAGTAMVEEISIDQMDYRDLAKKVAVVLTERIKGELLTCYDVVATGRYPYTGSLGILSQEDREIVKNAMERVKVDQLAARDFYSISDGQRQRVLLARAICQQPEIIVLDEPTSFLDIKHKLELLAILRSMAKEKGITVIMSLHEIDLAMKISDKVCCVKGETIRNFGLPQDIFTDENVRDLYEIEKGTYSNTFGSVELPRPEGEPDVFVISAGGTGIPVYRMLQQENRAFYAGILYENDIDYQVAKCLAMETVTSEAFSPMSDEAYARGLELMERCSRVINAGFPEGILADKLKSLVETAEKAGKLVDREDFFKKS